MQRLRRSGTAILGSLALPTLRKKASNSWYSVQDTYLSTKDVFERHRVVFTVGSSIASLAVAWAGYSLRYLHQERVEKRLESIEEAMKNNHHVENDEIKKIVNSGNVSLPSCVATAGTALIIGYGLGWRGGRWFANRKFQREKMKALMGPKTSHAQRLRWFLRRPLSRPQQTRQSSPSSLTTEPNPT